MNMMQKILSSLRRAVDGYNLIQEGDRVAVGVSGGKDSLVLLQALHNYSKFSPYKFEVVGITIDMFGDSDFNKIKEFCTSNNIEYHVIPSDIYKIVFEERKEKNPCSLCSKLRRGMLNTTAIDLGCNKLALGHSMDDAIHTFLLSLCYEGRINTLSPMSYLDRTGITVIRPLFLTDERDIIAASHNLPIVKSKCPVDKLTKREYVKDVIKFIQKEIPFVKERIFGAITSPDRVNLPPKLLEREEFIYKQKDEEK